MQISVSLPPRLIASGSIPLTKEVGVQYLLYGQKEKEARLALVDVGEGASETRIFPEALGME